MTTQQFFLILLIALGNLALLTNSACLSSEVYDPVISACATDCHPYYYIANFIPEKTCVPQDPVNNLISPTKDPFTFIVIFDKVEYSIFENTDAAWQFLTFSWNFGSKNVPILSVDIALSFLDNDHTIMQVVAAHKQEMPYPATLNIEFNDTTANSSVTFYFLNKHLSFDLLPFTDFTKKQQNLLDLLTNLDSYSDMGWSAVTLLTTYPMIYMQGKFYRETFNLYKMTGIAYSPEALEFFRRNDNRIAGIKVPNAASTTLYNRESTTGWERDKNSRILLEKDLNRDDYKIILTPRFHQFNTSPLLLDNIGVEITFFIGIVAATIIVELLAFFLFNDESSSAFFYRIFNGTRFLLRWNLILATIIGAYPSLIYYLVAQIKAFAVYGSIGHNFISSIIAIVLLVAVGLVFPPFLFWRIRVTNDIKERDPESIHYKEMMHLEFYGILHDFYKSDRMIYPMFMMIPVIRAIICSLITFFFEDIPTLQAYVMLALSVIILGLLVKFRPHSTIFYNVVQIVFEVLNLFALIIMVVLASSQSTLNSSSVEILNMVLVFIWIIIPYWTFGTGLYVLVKKIIAWYRARKAPKQPRRKSYRASVSVSVPVPTAKVMPIKIASHSTYRREVLEKQRTAETLVFDNVISPPSLQATSRKLDDEEGQFISTSRKRLRQVMHSKSGIL